MASGSDWFEVTVVDDTPRCAVLGDAAARLKVATRLGALHRGRAVRSSHTGQLVTARLALRSTRLELKQHAYETLRQRGKDARTIGHLERRLDREFEQREMIRDAWKQLNGKYTDLLARAVARGSSGTANSTPRRRSKTAVARPKATRHASTLSYWQSGAYL